MAFAANQLVIAFDKASRGGYGAAKPHRRPPLGDRTQRLICFRRRAFGQVFWMTAPSRPLKGISVARAELGTKRIDPETGKKFYDLNKDPIVSPYTGKSYPISFFITEAPALKEAVRAKAADADEDEEEIEVEAEDEILVEEDAEIVTLEDADEDEAPARKDVAAAPDVDGPGDDVVEDIEIEDDADEDETFLAEEEDEEEDDVSGYIGGGGRDDED
jgi:uncharacterized protein (TIGR02300 family)